MISFFTGSVFFGAFASIFFYEIGFLLKKKYKLAIINPLVISGACTIGVLLAFKIPYSVYISGAKYISYFMTPATVCLAVPLYEQINLLKKNAGAIFAGIISGVTISAVQILVFALIFNFSHKEYVTFLPKSITTPIGMGMSEKLGGYVSITVAIIIITGIIGNILAEPVCKLLHIKNPIAKGVAIGTSSHALGTAKAIEMGEIEGAMSGLSIAVAGVFTVVFSIAFSYFY